MPTKVIKINPNHYTDNIRHHLGINKRWLGEIKFLCEK